MRLILRPLAGFARPRYPFNINREENATYLKKIDRAEKQIDEAELAKAVPRRKRRIYDRPKHDRDITHYGAWRVFEEEEWLHKHNEHSMRVVAKINLSPKWLVHAFGMGALPISNPRSSSR